MMHVHSSLNIAKVIEKITLGMFKYLKRSEQCDGSEKLERMYTIPYLHTIHFLLTFPFFFLILQFLFIL